MEQNEIINALECCITNQHGNCCNLAKWHEQWNCMTDLMKKALALIKGLTKDNETLTIQCNAWHLAAERVGEEIQVIKANTMREIIAEILLNHTTDIDGFFTMHETELDELKKKYESEGEKR